MEQHQIDVIPRIDRTDAWDQRRLTVAVQRLEGEAACVHFAPFFHEDLDLIVEVMMTRECGVSERGKASLHSECHARSIQEHGGLKPLAQEPLRLQQVDEPYGALECHGVK